MDRSPPSQEDLFEYFYQENLAPYLSFHHDTEFTAKTAKAITGKFLESFPQDKGTLRIMDIGCGGGNFARYLVKEVVSLRPKLHVHLTAADPSPNMLALTKKRLKSVPPHIKVEFQQVGVYSQPAPRLCESLGGNNVNLLCASFILAWIDDWNDVLDQFLECLVSGGSLCVIQLSREYGKEYAEFRRRVFEIAHRDTGLQHVFAEAFEEILLKRRIKYDTQVVCHSADFGPDWYKKINGTMEFFLRFPRDRLLEDQIKNIKECTRIAFAKGPLKSCKKILWVKNDEQ